MINPLTGRTIQYGGATHLKLVRNGVLQQVGGGNELETLIAARINPYEPKKAAENMRMALAGKEFADSTEKKYFVSDLIWHNSPNAPFYDKDEISDCFENFMKQAMEAGLVDAVLDAYKQES
jgi:hypothetical protein